MRNPMSSLSPRAEKAAVVALLVLLYALAYAFEPGTFPELLVRTFFWAAGFATGWALAYATPSPRPLGRRTRRLVASSDINPGFCRFFGETQKRAAHGGSRATIRGRQAVARSL